MAYGLTKSLDLEISSAQVATVADDTAFDLNGNTFTLEAWINTEAIASSTNMVILGKWTTSGNQRSWVFRLNDASGTRTLQMVTDADGAAGSATAKSSDTLTVSTATWYHAAVSVSSGACTFYWDGVETGTPAGNLDAANVGTSVVTVGGERSDGTDGWDGKLSLIRVWKGEARSAAEINDNKCEVLGSTTNLSAEWTLDDVYTDNSGNGFTLTPANSPVFATDVPATCAATIAADNALTMCNF